MHIYLLRFFLVISWFVSSVSTLLFAVNMQNVNYQGKGFEALVRTTLSDGIVSYSMFSATPSLIGNIATSLAKGDARPVLLDRFFSRFRSPLYGYGEKLVEEADNNDIDWRLLAGIAFQESNLCAKIPDDSYNCWGWAIYTGQNSGAAFRNLDDAIEKITLGLKSNYYEKGLDTPSKIMAKYTPSSNGSWAEGVQYAFDLIEN